LATACKVKATGIVLPEVQLKILLVQFVEEVIEYFTTLLTALSDTEILEIVTMFPLASGPADTMPPVLLVTVVKVTIRPPTLIVVVRDAPATLDVNCCNCRVFPGKSWSVLDPAVNPPELI